MTRRSPILLLFFEIFTVFSKTGRFRCGGRPWLGFESCKSVVDSMMKCLPVKLKSIFGKNNGQAIKDPQFKFQPVPAESAEGGLNCWEYLRGSGMHAFWRPSENRAYFEIDMELRRLV